MGYKARNGKGTAAKAITEARGDKYDIRIMSFADALRDEVRGREFELCLKHNVPYDPNPPVDEMYPNGKQRALLQFWGTEYRRKQDPFYWVKKLKERIDKEQPQIVLIDDMRMKNEYLFVRINDGHTVKVTRHGFSLLDPVAAAHPSETDLDGITFDYEIQVLDGEVEQLKKDAVTVFDMIVKTLEPPDTDFSVPEDPNGEEAVASHTDVSR